VRTRLIFPTVVLLLVVALSPAKSGQNAAQQSTGPDISGVWLVTKFQPKLFPNGGAPFTPWGEAKSKTFDLKTNDPDLGCLPDGLPKFMFWPYPMEIFQVASRVVIIHEGIQVMRQIYMNREHLKDLDPTYSGDSVGKWEGDTLVVDTIGFNDKTWLDPVGGLPHSEAMHLVERIRRTDHDTLVDDMTIEDPVAYTKPITAHLGYKLKSGWEIREYVCEENNKYTYQGK
jgi:hypothetical protein